MGISREQARDRLCLALDVATISEVESLVAEMKDYVGLFKVGKQLFTSEGPSVIKRIRELGGSVFLDLKYHDIPNTVAEASRSATRLGTAILNIHASGGAEMIRAAADAVRDEAMRIGIEKPKVLAVTVLTSLTTKMLHDELHIALDLPDQVKALARLAEANGADGVISSPQEISLIRENCGENFLVLTPGIRPSQSDAQDQKRTMSPRQAIEMGANYLVVGRPILQATDRAAAANMILDDMVGYGA